METLHTTYICTLVSDTCGSLVYLAYIDVFFQAMGFTYCKGYCRGDTNSTTTYPTASVYTTLFRRFCESYTTDRVNEVHSPLLSFLFLFFFSLVLGTVCLVGQQRSLISPATSQDGLVKSNSRTHAPPLQNLTRRSPLLKGPSPQILAVTEGPYRFCHH
jgi:hypothetical protein